VFALGLTRRNFAKNAAKPIRRKFSIDADSVAAPGKTRVHHFETIGAPISKRCVHHLREFGRASQVKTATNQRPSW